MPASSSKEVALTTTPTPVKLIPEIVSGARSAFNRGVTRPIAWRREQLSAILRLLEENSAAIYAALKADLRRPTFEAILAECGTVSHNSCVMAQRYGMCGLQMVPWRCYW